MRIVTRTCVAGLLGVVVGCGGGGTPPENKPADNQQPAAKGGGETPAPGGSAAVTPKPPGDTPPKPPEPPADPWVLDPAKQVTPAGTAAGRLVKEPFAPTEVAAIVGPQANDAPPTAAALVDTLCFRVLKDGQTVKEIAVKFSPAQAAKLPDGLTVTVKPDAPPDAANVPEVTLLSPALPEGKPISYPGGYGMTLEVGKKANGRLPGKVYLVLDDPDKSYLAGTFDADWQRPPTTPPGPDDAPFVRGTVTVPPDTKEEVKVGYVGLTADATPLNDSVQSALVGTGGFSMMNLLKPRASALLQPAGQKGVGKYEHVHLSPGRYLVYAKVDGGPMAFKWVQVDAGGQQVVDLAVEAGKTGGVAVTLPKDGTEPKETTNSVYLVPAGGPDGKVDANAAATIGFPLGLSAAPKDGVAKFDKVPAGKYEVWAADKLGALDVKTGETAKLDVPPPKPKADETPKKDTPDPDPKK